MFWAFFLALLNRKHVQLLYKKIVYKTEPAKVNI